MGGAYHTGIYSCLLFIHFYETFGLNMVSLNVFLCVVQPCEFVDMVNTVLLFNIIRKPNHRHDSIQGTDYIANPFFLNLKVSRKMIQNLR